jgi:hypothetical protein
LEKVKKIGIICVILILVLSFGLFLYYQSVDKEYVESRLINEEKERQLESTKIISGHIESDMNIVVQMLDGLANSKYFQEGNLIGNESEKLLEEKYNEFQEVINQFLVIDKNGVVRTSLESKGAENFLGRDFSSRDWLEDTTVNRSLTISGGFERQGAYRVFIAYPIINRESNEYIGTIGISIPTVPFFSKYGNVELGDRQFLVAYDRSGTILANGVEKTLVGQSFFGGFVQDFINRNAILNNATRLLLEGKQGYSIYDDGKGERLNTQYPVFIDGRPEFFIQIVTPTAQIHSQIQEVLSAENLKMLTLFISTFVSVAVLIFLLAKWNSTLSKEVQKKTMELLETERRKRQIEESYEHMKDYLNEVLREVKIGIGSRRG